MLHGTPFRPQRTGDRMLDGITQEVANAFSQLEDLRRGLLTAQVLLVQSNQQLGEQLIVVYNGPGAHTLTLPPADLLGAARGQVMLIANQSAVAITVAPSRGQMVNGATSVALAANKGVLVFSDGDSAWTTVGP